MHVLVDGDPIVYSRGVAGEDRVYEVIIQDKATGEYDAVIFDNGNEKNKWLKELDDNFEVVDQEMIRTARPVHHALGPIKRTIVGIKNEVASKFDLHVSDLAVEVFLTGPGNFRDEVAKEKKYKGNRDRSMRPIHYDACREYLETYYNAQVIEGDEADDAISIMARVLTSAGVPVVICTVDKDLDQIPGHFFNYDKKVWYEIDDFDAMVLFYEQVLSGDGTDNIPGIYRIGKKKAHTMIHKWLNEYSANQWDYGMEEHLWKRIVEEYSDSMDKHPDRYVSDDPETVAIENARLVKMQDYVGQLWTPPGYPDEVIGGTE